jgi:hypothetical protein
MDLGFRWILRRFGTRTPLSTQQDITTVSIHAETKFWTSLAKFMMQDLIIDQQYVLSSDFCSSFTLTLTT